MKTIIVTIVLMLALPNLAPAGTAGRGTIPSARSSAPETAPSIPDQPGSDDVKALLPAIEEYRVELSKARMKIRRFDLSKGRDLVMLTGTKVSVPAMKEVAKKMVKRAEGIADTGLKEEMMAHIKNLSNLLKSQEDNRTDKDGMANAFNLMEKILNQMENP
jgi:hypothetical protein